MPGDTFKIAPIEEADAARAPKSAWPALMVEMIDAAEAELRRIGSTAELAQRHAQRVVLALAALFGGRPFYLPTGTSLRRAIRDDEIFRRARAGNIAALAQEFGMTQTNIYRVIARQRALRRAVPHCPHRNGPPDDTQ